MTNIRISKIESKSQRFAYQPIRTATVTNIRISKIESKSQRYMDMLTKFFNCDKYQNFKDRKQITTYHYPADPAFPLWQISEFQRSKANHNFLFCRLVRWSTVTNIRISKIESKSQPNQVDIHKSNTVTNIRISKIESKSQHIRFRMYRLYDCDKYQNFKDRKQITTK